MSLKIMTTLNETEQRKTPELHKNGNQGNTQPTTLRRRIPIHLLLLSSSFE
jgi:hypothetical protein